MQRSMVMVAVADCLAALALRRPHWLTDGGYGGRPQGRGKGRGHKQKARAQATRNRKRR